MPRSPRCELVPVQAHHMARVAARMRAGDVREVWASHHYTPREALARGVRTAARSWTGLVDKQPVCVFGVSPSSILTGEGAPWMLATDELARVERPFVRLSRPAVEAMLEVCPRLVNWVDDRNTRAHAWLAWLGFELDAPVPYGREGLPFRRFSRSS